MADSLSKISAMLESARELTLEAASSASARLMDETPLRPKDISALLNGRSDREKLSGMKQVITMMVKGEDCSMFFADVIKNIASGNIETRKLVYTYLLRYAEHEPDLALLSINTIQKSLADQSPLIRSLAIRVMSGIRVPVISPIVTLAIKQCAKDLSPIVRLAAAQAIAKCYALDPSNSQQMQEQLEKLLADESTAVVAASLVTLSKTFPDRLDLIHQLYRPICRSLHSFDEWAQVVTLDMLMRYARMYIAKPRRYKRPHGTTSGEKLGEEVDLHDSSDDSSDILVLDDDLELLFSSISSLLYSRNGSVVMAVAKLYYYLGIPQTFEKYKVAGPVVRLMRSDSAVQQVALANIRTMALKRQKSFLPFLDYFFVFPTEPTRISKLKIQILTLLCTESNIKTVLAELKYYALCDSGDQHAVLVAESMQAIGRCAVEIPSYSTKILKWLLKQIKKSSDDLVVGEVLSVIRVLVQRDFENQIPTVVRLAKSLIVSDNSTQEIVPSAKAAILWLVGELAGTAHEVAVEVLRANCKDFAQQDDIVRYQLVLLAAKVYSCHLDRKSNEDIESEPLADEFVPKLFDYVMHLARYDSNYDTRDRARMFGSLLNSSISTEIATLVLQAPKPSPIISLREKLTAGNVSSPLTGSSTSAAGNLLLGSSSLVMGHPLDHYHSLPPWVHPDQLIDPSVREEPEPKNPAYVKPSSASSVARQQGISNKSITSSDEYSASHGVFNGRKLTDQSLDDFFSDVQVPAKTGLTQKVDEGEEDYSSSEGEEEEEDDDEDEYEDEDDEDEDEDEDEDGSSDEYESSSEEKEEDADDDNEKTAMLK